MKKFIVLFAIIFSGFALGQRNSKDIIHPPPPPALSNNSINKEDLKIFEKVDEKPVFTSEVMTFEENFIQNFDNSIFDDENQDKIDFCKISFICEKNGTVTNVSQISTTNRDLSTGSIRAIKSFRQRYVFNPATIKGNAVRYKMVIKVEYNYKKSKFFVTILE